MVESGCGGSSEPKFNRSNGGNRGLREKNLFSPFSPAYFRKPMHPLFQKATGLTETIIAAAVEVHRDKGPGLPNGFYAPGKAHANGL